MSTFIISDPAAQSFAFYSGVLVLKTLGMSVLTSATRCRKKVYANEEDARKSNGVVKFDDPDVERVRRAHRNDLENIPAFLIVGGLYLSTNPTPETAINLFRAYAAGRVLHSIVYAVKPLPQPARGISYGVPFFIMVYMGVKVVMHYASAK